ncbi:MAG: metal ABC transporter substrate-binding protein [Clostridia bacterium]
MKKIIAILVALTMVVGLFAACSSTTTEEENTEKLTIVTTIFPIYDWVMQVLGDNADDYNVVMLMDTGVDLHSYEATADDLITIYESDMFIYNGGESDEWVEDALENATNPDMVVIDLLVDVLGDDALMEVSVDGMQEEEEEDHDHDEDEEETDAEEEDHDHDEDEDTTEAEEVTEEDEEDHDHDEDETEEDEEEHEHSHEDEHIWLSLNNAQIFTSYLADEFAALDADNADTYTANADAYNTELAALDLEYAAVVEAGAFDTILFADRFPFRYLTEDYDIEYFAAFSGCSSETEASFETITFLADKVDELGLTSILIIDGATTDIADTVIANTATGDQEILVLDSMQSITAADIEDGASYLDIMTSNLEVLESALN